MDSPNSARFHFVESGRHPDDNAGRGAAVQRGATQVSARKYASRTSYELIGNQLNLQSRAGDGE
jgi:hypothetical protein